ncbi:MAG: 1-acylglycerol-3-phosphate O-acyltransferase [Luteitalea sp.]|nr:1-acylglycerol-3-phosphate O-acyltransferase [Luteitalea sp.]
MLIAALRSLITYVAVSLYVLVIGPIGMGLALLFRWKDLLYILGHLGVKLALVCSGITFRVEGRGQAPQGGAVYCSNHQSNVDPPVLFDALHPRLHILYKAELNRIPILTHAFRLGGFIPVDRYHKEAAMRAIDKGARSIRSGNSFLIFPEGTRSKTADLLPFKKGGFIMAIKAQAPIVPVAITGGRDAMRRGSLLVYPVHIRVRVGAPIPTVGLTLDQRDVLIARTRAAMAALLERGAEMEQVR